MKTSLFLILMTGLLLSACSKKADSAAQGTNATSSGNPVTAPADYLGALAKGKVTAQKTVETAGLTQTIQIFYAQEGRFPKDLNELVGPGYLNKLPEPPNGMKFNYNPANGTVSIVPK